MTYSSMSTQKPADEPGVNPNVRRSANMDTYGYRYVSESRETRKTNERVNQNSVKETATKMAPKITNLTISAIIHLPYRLRRDESGNPVQAISEYGERMIDTETRLPLWERESVDPLPAASIEELKRQIAQASGIDLADIPLKIEVSQVPWMAPVHTPTGGETLVAMTLRWFNDNKTNIITFVFFCLAVYMVYRYAIRPIPTEADEELEQEAMTLAMTTVPDDDEKVDEEWETLRAKVAAAVSEDPKRAANLLRRWMKKE
jgi:flagellar biosynthesis/type III secretory pathway M-ring protein FliF/YscJ